MHTLYQRIQTSDSVLKYITSNRVSFVQTSIHYKDYQTKCRLGNEQNSNRFKS